MKTTALRVVELFAGVGGFRLGFEKAGHKVVWANEWNKYASDIYDRRFGGLIDRRDLTTVDASEIPDHDILVGGFPCQAFSVAGKRAGFDDTRGTLFFDVARILAHKKPRYLLLENVKGLLTHDNGRTYQTIVRVLTDLGYVVEWQVLNSKNFGVPQSRERVFIIGYLRGERRPEVLPIARDYNQDAGGDENQISGTIDTGYAKNHRQSGATYINVVGNLNDEKWSRFNESSRRVYDIKGIAPTVPTSAGGGHVPKVAIPVLTPDRLVKRQNGRRFKNDGDPQFTLNTQDRHGVYDGQRIRRLTPLECERLQGFPDGWGDSVSDTQRYKVMGNAVTVNVIEALASRIIPPVDN